MIPSSKKKGGNLGSNLRSSRDGQGADLVRDHLLTAIHVGRLCPGDRVPSVRRLAKIAGVNHKTVHRTYTALCDEGILDVRPGSGTFVRKRALSQAPAPPPELAAALKTLLAEADRLGLAPDLLSEFFNICCNDGLRGTELALVECNWEQIAMIGRDVQRELGVRTRPVRLDVLARNPTMALGGLRRVLTTDCHYAEVVELLEPLGISVHTVTLNERFPREILGLARRGEVLMVLRDSRFATSFVRLLEQLCPDPQIVGRVAFVDECDALRELGQAGRGVHVYFSPLVRPSMHRALPRTAKRIEGCWHVAEQALEMLKAELGMEKALQPHPR